jgi:putative oxidoreductase
MNVFKAIFFGGDASLRLSTEISLFIMRVFFGLAMAFGHGLGKFPPPDRLVDSVTGLGFPAPEFFAWCATFGEFFGGLFVALGLLTRPAALLVIFTMGVAAFGAHGAELFGGDFGASEMALLYFFGFVPFLLLGSGKIGVDHIIRTKALR